MRLFGEKVGIAFQIKDDLFDYGAANIGKPTGHRHPGKENDRFPSFTPSSMEAKNNADILLI